MGKSYNPPTISPSLMHGGGLRDGLDLNVCSTAGAVEQDIYLVTTLLRRNQLKVNDYRHVHRVVGKVLIFLGHQMSI